MSWTEWSLSLSEMDYPWYASSLLPVVTFYGFAYVLPNVARKTMQYLTATTGDLDK